MWRRDPNPTAKGLEALSGALQKRDSNPRPRHYEERCAALPRPKCLPNTTGCGIRHAAQHIAKLRARAMGQSWSLGSPPVHAPLQEFLYCCK